MERTHSEEINDLRTAKRTAPPQPSPFVMFIRLTSLPDVSGLTGAEEREAEMTVRQVSTPLCHVCILITFNYHRCSSKTSASAQKLQPCSMRHLLHDHVEHNTQ